MSKKYKRISAFSIITILLIVLIYICNITNLPDNIILFEGEKLKLNTIFGINIETEFSSNPNIERIENNETATVATEALRSQDVDSTGTINLGVKLFRSKGKRNKCKYYREYISSSNRKFDRG